ncbi:Retrovirus-related Pol polyprotein from transposon TNT 1-94-like protein [Drosera capensis]
MSNSELTVKCLVCSPVIENQERDKEWPKDKDKYKKTIGRKLEEEIYMTQPEGFEVKGQESKVCNLNRFIYGLK